MDPFDKITCVQSKTWPNVYWVPNGANYYNGNDFIELKGGWYYMRFGSMSGPYKSERGAYEEFINAG
jgi:hypothetical protein